MMETTVSKLNRLADLQDARAVMALDYDAKRAAILAVVQDELNALDAELKPAIAVADDSIAALTNEVKADVLAEHTSVKGARLHAVYAKGRVSWDSKRLDGMMIVIPQLGECRKEGEPSVSLRTI